MICSNYVPTNDYQRLCEPRSDVQGLHLNISYTVSPAYTIGILLKIYFEFDTDVPVFYPVEVK